MVMKVDKEVREDNTLLEEIKMLSRLSHENVLRFAMFSFFLFFPATCLMYVHLQDEQQRSFKSCNNKHSSNCFLVFRFKGVCVEGNKVHLLTEVQCWLAFVFDIRYWL